MKKLIKLWRRMALRGKLLCVALLLVLCGIAFGIGFGIYNLPVFVQNRAMASVDNLFAENGAALAEGVAQNTGRISKATQNVNKLPAGGLRDYLNIRIETAQQMADCEGGLEALYQTSEDGSRIPIKHIEAFQIENLDKTLKTLDNKGKAEFTAKIRQGMADARTQYETVTAVNQSIDDLFEDGSARTTLKNDVTNAACEEIDQAIDALENPELRQELSFAFVDIKKEVAAQVADQEALKDAEAEERQKEEAQQENNADSKSLWDRFIDLFRP